jgi:hypothetical protein
MEILFLGFRNICGLGYWKFDYIENIKNIAA